MIAIPFSSRTLTCYLWMFSSIVLLADAPRPESGDSSGLRAWELLGEYYQSDPGSRTLDQVLGESLRNLDSDDTSAGAQAGEFLMALLRQVMADEKNGRAKWNRSMAWGGGADSPARAFREQLAELLKRSKAMPAAVPVAQWILENDRLPESLAAATSVLEAARHRVGDEALRGILGKGCSWRPAVVMALTETGKRGHSAESVLISKWASDPCLSIRSAAVACLQRLGQQAPPAFNEERGFTPELETDLGQILQMLTDPPAGEARFGEFKVREVAKNGETETSTEIGWLRKRTDQKVYFMNWYAENREIRLDGPEKTEVEFTEMDLSGAAEKLILMRREDGSDTGGRLSKDGAFTAQFEPSSLSVPEAVFSAWLWSKGEKAMAAKVLFPRLDVLSDSRWAEEIMRDLIGGTIHLEMLAAFSYQRNYEETLRLAKHLGGPLFDGYRYQTRARELAAQLPARAADFRAFKLPPPAEWKKLSAEMPRETQLEFLASRLRLLNCFQWSQPGDVNLNDVQYSKAGILFQGQKENEALIVINPLNEILDLKPVPADLPVLVPFLRDHNFLPTFSYWRSFHPGRTLHRVNESVSWVINTAAMHELVDVDDWQALSQEEQNQRVDKVMDWAREMSGKAPWEIIRFNLERASGEWQWFNAARFAVKHSNPELMGALLAGAERFPGRKGDILKLAFNQGAKGVLQVAGVWSQLPDPELRIFSALSLIRHGTPEQRAEALVVLGKAVLEFEGYDTPEAVNAMLSLNDEAVTGIACSTLRNPKLDWSYTGKGLVHRLFLTKHPEVLRLLSGLLASKEDPHRVAGIWKEAEVERISTRGDDVAMAVAAMRMDYEYEEYAPDADRVTAREELAKWLARQSALLKEGQPTPGLKLSGETLRSPRWEIDAP